MDPYALCRGRSGLARSFSTLFGLMLLTAVGGCKGSSSSTTLTNNLRAVGCSASQCVAVGDNQTIVTSTDGVNWTAHIQPEIPNPSSFSGPATLGYVLTGVAASPSRWVAVGWSNDGAIPEPNFYGIALTSFDGITWTPVTNSVINNDAQYNVIWSGTQFATVAYEQVVKEPLVAPIGGTVYSSPDGLKWTSATAPETSVTAGSLSGIAWSGKQYVVVGYNNALASSPDGVTWTARTSPETNAYYKAVAWSGTLFVAVGSAGSSAVIDTSPDGVTWTSVNGSGISGLESIAWSGKDFVAVGSGGIYSSLDGTRWTHQAAPIGAGLALHGVAFGRSEFLAVGDAGTILTSLDGVIWTKQSGP